MSKRPATEIEESVTKYTKSEVPNDPKSVLAADDEIAIIYQNKKYKFDPRNLQYSSPIQNKMSKSIDLTYLLKLESGKICELKNFTLQTDVCESKFGLSIWDKTLPKKYSVDISFPGDSAIAFDEANAKALKANGTSWYGKRQDDVPKLSKMVSRRVKRNDPSVESPPSIKFKIPVREDKKTGDLLSDVGVFDESGKRMPNGISDLHGARNSKIRVQFKHNSLWLLSSAVYSTLQAKQIQIIELGKDTNSFGFV